MQQKRRGSSELGKPKNYSPHIHKVSKVKDHTRVKVELVKENSVNGSKKVSLSFTHLCFGHT